MSAQTMTKVISDAFLPMSFHHDRDARIPSTHSPGDPIAHMISPLTLPHPISGYLGVLHGGATHTQPVPVSGPPTEIRKPRDQVYSPLSPGARGGPPPYATSYFPPHVLSLDQQRPSSLPPTNRTPITSPEAARTPFGSQGWGSSVNGSIPPAAAASVGHSTLAQPDPLSPLSHDQVVQRLQQQNAKIREAWEAERKYLEANRERAEEVYKEERALMEEERAQWDAERAALIDEINRLRQALSMAEAGLLASGGGPPAWPQRNGAVLPNGSPSARPPKPQYLDLASPQLPNGPRAPVVDFLKPTGASEAASGPVPVVDVKEIHPELEGIPLKATGVKKATFTDTSSSAGSKTPSATGSPASVGSDKRKEQTLQVLAAQETERLTMHAGHTPGHSLSTLPTASSSGTASPSSNAGDRTPTAPAGEGAAEETAASDKDSPAPDNTNDAPKATAPEEHDVDHPEPVLEPSDGDRELKGPLMVRNVPAHDEIFFQALNSKLEKVSKDTRAAVPTVLASAVRPTRAYQHEDAGSDGASTPRSGDDEEIDVPLRFKRRLNFGAPFGEMM
ncbi:hypothetical protein VTJ83DRAFT_1588 [Remersonia thermophila]|uniref:Uncharacterized protein n=1 Tax=Remersonia thermophila TaxID=72144 RepID=A0ABR4DH94_9PEZI